MANHEHQLKNLVEQLETARDLQRRTLDKKLKERKEAREKALKKIQENELAHEYLEQSKELADVEIKAVCNCSYFSHFFTQFKSFLRTLLKYGFCMEFPRI